MLSLSFFPLILMPLCSFGIWLKVGVIPRNGSVLEGAGEEIARREKQERRLRSQPGITEIPVVENNHPIK